MKAPRYVRGMRYLILLAPVLLFACSTDAPAPSTEGEQPPLVPVAFEERSAVKDIVSGSEYSRSYSDVVEQMFKEELERDTALAHLFERINEAQSTFNDSANDFHRLKGNDVAFYQSANGHADQLTDTLDRKRMNDRLKASEARAGSRFTEWQQMEAAAEELTREVGQLRTLVMLDRTIKRMEDYQRTPVPGKKGMSEALHGLRAHRDQLRAEVRE
jgi:hypothetical protein